jgi:hypothetical protein
VALIGLRIDKLTVTLVGTVQDAGAALKLKNHREMLPAIPPQARDPERPCHHYVAKTLRNVLLTETDQFAHSSTEKKRMAPWARTSHFLLTRRDRIAWDLANLHTLILRGGVQIQAHQYSTPNVMISLLDRGFPADFACAVRHGAMSRDNLRDVKSNMLEIRRNSQSIVLQSYPRPRAVNLRGWCKVFS